MATNRRALKRVRVYRGEHFWSLMFGAATDDPTPPSVELLRELWEAGGRSAVLDSPTFQKAGWRAWAFWQFDFPDDLKKQIEAGADLLTEMEILELSGFARPGERDAYEVAEAEAEAEDAA